MEEKGCGLSLLGSGDTRTRRKRRRKEEKREAKRRRRKIGEKG